MAFIMAIIPRYKNFQRDGSSINRLLTRTTEIWNSRNAPNAFWMLTPRYLRRADRRRAEEPIDCKFVTQHPCGNSHARFSSHWYHVPHPLSCLGLSAVSRDDAEAMRVEALGDRAPEKVLGDAPYVMDQPIAPLDLTNGQNANEPGECESVHVRTTLSDGTKVSKVINMCD